jgi:hypothetical protein
MKNEHLVPDLIKDLVSKLSNAKSQNEKMSLEDRIIAINEYLTISLEKLKKKKIL